MDRRAFLAAAAGVAGGLAGCAGGDAESTGTPAGGERPLARRGFPGSICGEDRTDTDIEAIVEPAFDAGWADVSADSDYADGVLTGEEAVIGIQRDGRARAYPVSVLWHHEVVNDSIPPAGSGDGAGSADPVVVTYCPLCSSGMVAERVVDGEPTAFGVSGLLWRPPGIWTAASEQANRTFGVTSRNASSGVSVRNSGNLVLYDAATGSYWSQLLAEAICGPRRGDRLSIVPSTTATWNEWRAAHPDTEVLLPPPHSSAGNPRVDG